MPSSKQAGTPRSSTARSMVSSNLSRASRSMYSTFPARSRCRCLPAILPPRVATLVVDGGNYRHDFVAQAVVDGLMRAGMDTGVPVLSVSLTPHHYQDTEHHKRIFREHFVLKGREAAQAALMIGRTRAMLAAA